MNYQEQIKSPAWQKKRLEILNRDKFKCLMCGDSETELHVHHLYYDRDLKIHEYDQECYVTLCKKCHVVAHKEIAKISGLIAFCYLKKGHDFQKIYNQYINNGRAKNGRK
jgi:5-methylcytosine-specific restriction endonuclease McrA